MAKEKPNKLKYKFISLKEVTYPPLSLTVTYGAALSKDEDVRLFVRFDISTLASDDIVKYNIIKSKLLSQRNAIGAIYSGPLKTEVILKLKTKSLNPQSDLWWNIINVSKSIDDLLYSVLGKYLEDY